MLTNIDVQTAAVARFRLHWPTSPPLPLREDFFVGAFCPRATVMVDFGTPPKNIEPVLARGNNWFALSNSAPGVAGKPGLVHARPRGEPLDSPAGLVFRGYILTPPTHSFSSPESLYDYWRIGGARTHNGVFACIRIWQSRLELISDAFGISPLYYRQLACGVWLFSSSPRYLRLPGDRVEPIAERMILHRGAVCGNASLLAGVERVPPGSVLTITDGIVTKHHWFPFSELPQGDQPITPAGVRDSEEAFQAAMDRCLRLMPGGSTELPLSSGDDSRRILAALSERGSAFNALTVRVFQQNNRDFDGRFTALMAKELGFSHKVLECAPPHEYAEDDSFCRRLFSSEVSEHAWIMPLIRKLSSTPGVVFDGLAGDILGNTGFGIADHFTMPVTAVLPAVVRKALPDCPGLVRESEWASLEATREKLLSDLSFLPGCRNVSDYAFLLIRARRGTALWSQYLLPPGKVGVYPYLDLDHVHVAMRFSSLEKLENNLTRTLQARCLERFWPSYYAFPGSRRYPPDLMPEPENLNELRGIARMDKMRSECAYALSLEGLRERLPLGRYAAALLSAASMRLKQRVRWWLDPILMVEAYRAECSGALSCEVTRRRSTEIWIRVERTHAYECRRKCAAAGA